LSTLAVHYCSFCAGERPFEVPPCADDHDDCPDLACTDCGFAVVFAPVASGRIVLTTAAAGAPTAGTVPRASAA